MQSNSKDYAEAMAEKVAVKGSVDLTLQQSAIQVGELLNVHSTYEEDRKILRKIDRL
jgi:hypothetical protein